MITNTTDSYQIPSQNKTKPKLQIWKKKCRKFKFWNRAKILHFLKLRNKMCKYEMVQARILEVTERTRLCPQTDRRTDGRRETGIPPFQIRWSGGKTKYNEDVCIFHGMYFKYKALAVHTRTSVVGATRAPLGRAVLAEPLSLEGVCAVTERAHCR